MKDGYIIDKNCPICRNENLLHGQFGYHKQEKIYCEDCRLIFTRSDSYYWKTNEPHQW